MSGFWYCKKCGFGPHDPAIHLACIMCGRIHDASFSTDPSDGRALEVFGRLVAPTRELIVPSNDLHSSNDSNDGSSVSLGLFGVTLLRQRLLPASLQLDQLPQYNFP